ncbi:MAG: sortase [Nocardioides sp.]
MTATVAPPVQTPKPTRPAPTGQIDRNESVWIVISTSLTMLALVCGYMAMHLIWFSQLSADRAQELLYAEFRANASQAVGPVGPVVPVGDPVAVITIPALDLQQVVTEGTASGDLLGGPGHQRNTVIPGQVGTSVVMGRAATYGAPFKDLPALQVGDLIEVTSGQGEIRFVVTGIRRDGDPLPQPAEPGTARLALVTAEGSGRFGALSPGTSIYVDAESSKGFPAPSGRPLAVPDSELAMATDQGARPLLALCLALLLAMTLLVIAARQRWTAALVWVVAAPVVIALSWVTTDVVMRLLPNLI